MLCPTHKAERELRESARINRFITLSKKIFYFFLLQFEPWDAFSSQRIPDTWKSVLQEQVSTPFKVYDSYWLLTKLCPLLFSDYEVKWCSNVLMSLHLNFSCVLSRGIISNGLRGATCDLQLLPGKTATGLSQTHARDQHSTLAVPAYAWLAEPVRLLDLDRGPVLWLVGKIFANVCSVIFSGLFTFAATWKLVLPGQIGCMSHRKGDLLNAREHSQVPKDTWHTYLFLAARAYSCTFTFMLWYYRI